MGEHRVMSEEGYKLLKAVMGDDYEITPPGGMYVKWSSEDVFPEHMRTVGVVCIRCREEKECTDQARK